MEGHRIPRRGVLVEMVAKRQCSFQSFEQLVGRLNHSSYVMPVARHFLSRLRSRLNPRPKHPKRQRMRLSENEVGDLELWQRLLARANQGISINLLVTRQPDQICWSDACPFGIGGYSLSGRAWRTSGGRKYKSLILHLFHTVVQLY